MPFVLQYYFFGFGWAFPAIPDDQPIIESNEIFFVTGTSDSVKNNFIGSICQNLLEFQGVKCNFTYFTDKMNIHPCVNPHIFGKKIVKIVDAPGLCDIPSGDEYFSNNLQDLFIN